MAEDAKAHRPIITGLHGMGSTGHSLASFEAVNVLKKGGNAMDAALAAAGVLSVIKSYHCGLGGDVFALYYSASDEKLSCLNGSGKSPIRLRRDFYREEIPTRGALAANVPGAVDAWVQLADRFATRPLKELWEPAIDYAANGFPVFPHLARVIKSFGERGHKDPAWAQIFFPNGKPLQVNEILIQNDLARTLSEVGRDGRNASMRVAWPKPSAEHLKKKADVLLSKISTNTNPSGKLRYAELTGAMMFMFRRRIPTACSFSFS